MTAWRGAFNRPDSPPGRPMAGVEVRMVSLWCGLRRLPPVSPSVGLDGPRLRKVGFRGRPVFSQLRLRAGRVNLNSTR